MTWSISGGVLYSKTQLMIRITLSGNIDMISKNILEHSVTSQVIFSRFISSFLSDVNYALIAQ